MSRTRFVTVLGLLGALLAAGCGKSEEGSTSSGAVTAAAGPKISLRMNLEPGSSYRLDMTTDQDIEQTIGNQKQTIDQTIGMGMRFDCQSVDDQGNFVVQITYDAIKFRQVGPMGPIEYDSSKDQATDNPLAAGFAGLLDQSFTVVFDSTGQPVEVRGVEKMIDNIAAKMPAPNEEVRAQMKEALRKQLGDQAMKQMMGNMPAYPAEPVGVGDKWENTASIGSPVAMTATNSVTFASRKDGKATLKIKSTLAPGPQGEQMEMGKMKMDMTIEGDQGGTMVIDEATGVLVEGTMQQDLNCTMTMTGGPQTMTIPMKIKSTVRMTGKKL